MFGEFLYNAVTAGPWLENARVSRYQLIFTNGVFDILHRGHVEFLAHLALKYASTNGIVIVALNNDESAKRLKGNSRPINTLADRAAVVGGLRSVAAVMSFPEDTPEQLLKVIRPAVLAKGGEYKKDIIPGENFVHSYGGKVYKHMYLPNYSTTSVIDKLIHL